MPEITINNFSGGISDSTRMMSTNAFAFSKHFDIYSDPKKLIPYKSFEEDQDLTYKITDFLYYGSKIYGYGVVVGTGRVKVYEKSSLTASWAESTTGQDTAGARTTGCFIEYKGKLYGFTAGNRVWSYEVSTNTFTATARSISYTNITQGLVGNDDVLYLAYDNKIATLDNTTWTDAAITLPTGLVITSIDEYSEYLAIGCRSSNYSNSVVYLWDKTSTDVNQIIDFGEGNLKVLANVDGNLIGISSSTLTTSDAFTYRPKAVFRRYVGGNKAIPFKELVSDDSSLFIGQMKAKKGSVVFFPMSIKWNGTSYYGIWSLGRKGEGYNYVLSLDQMPDNDTAVTSIDGMFLLGDYWFVAHNGDGSVNRTDDQAVYSTTSVLETEKFKLYPLSQLEAVSVYFEPMPSGGQVVLKYRKDEESSWTTLFTETTQNELLHTASNIEPSGGQLPSFKEIQFRVESTGNVGITGINMVYSRLEQDNG